MTFQIHSPCCRDFDLDLSPFELKILHKFLIKNKSLSGIKPTQMNKYTITFMVDNLIFLRMDYQRGWSNRKKAPSLKYHYSCKKLDLTTGKCTQYNLRPQFCREFPDIDPCPYSNCSSSHCKNKG